MLMTKIKKRWAHCHCPLPSDAFPTHRLCRLNLIAFAMFPSSNPPPMSPADALSSPNVIAAATAVEDEAAVAASSAKTLAVPLSSKSRPPPPRHHGNPNLGIGFASSDDHMVAPPPPPSRRALRLPKRCHAGVTSSSRSYQPPPASLVVAPWNQFSHLHRTCRPRHAVGRYRPSICVAV